MPAPTRSRPSVLEHVDRTARVYSLTWGRSVRGCAECGDRDRPAGYELKVDGRLIERLCASCAGARTLPELLERARDRARARRR